MVLFHTYDKETELNFDFDNSPKKFVDIETEDEINVFASDIKKQYQESVADYFKTLKTKCLQYQIDYVPVNIREGFTSVLTSYLISRRKFL